MTELLQPDRFPAALESIPAWTYEAPFIERTITFHDYLAGVDSLAAVAELAELHNHHPELTLSWRKLRIQLTTHSKGGVTALDLEMARRINALLADSVAT